MESSFRDWRPRRQSTLARLTIAFSVVGAACGLSASSPSPIVDTPRPRAFVGTFDRVLIAGFLSERVSDRGRELDVNVETSRLLRMTLRTKAALHVIDAPPVHVPQISGAVGDLGDAVFRDVAYWKRLGEEYREPLILTGAVMFERAGPQSIEQQIGPRTVSVARPRFRLDMRLVFISGRTGEVLDSLSLGPVAMQARDGRESALALYFALMDRLTPAVLSLFGA